MSDTLIQFVHDTVTLHDTLKDTVLVASLALNSVKSSSSQFWISFAPVLASIITALVTLIMFASTYRKDVKFHKEKELFERERYKFQKNHDKTVTIAELFFEKLHYIFEEIEDYRSAKLSGASIIENPKGSNDYKKSINNCIESIRDKCKQSTFYIEDNILDIVFNLTTNLSELLNRDFVNYEEYNVFKTTIKSELNSVILKLKQTINGKLD